MILSYLKLEKYSRTAGEKYSQNVILIKNKQTFIFSVVVLPVRSGILVSTLLSNGSTDQPDHITIL